MKKERIVANDIKKNHPQQKSHSTDLYYQRLANELQDRMLDCGIGLWDYAPKVIHQAAITLTSYLEDIVADSGPWRMFSQLCLQMYGHPVPMYHEPEEYYPDEPSLNAVRYILWATVSEVSGDIVFADGRALEKVAAAAYDILNEAFEEAPVNEQLADDIDYLLRFATEGFDQMRSVLLWLFTGCYLTTGKNNEDLLNRHTEEAMSMMENDDMPLITPRMAMFYSATKCAFSYQIGPLALYPKDWLAELMRLKGMEKAASDVEKIEMLYAGTYKYEFSSPGRLLLTRTNGRQIELPAEDLNMTDMMLREHDGCIATSFIYYQQEWHLNGMVFPVEGIAKKWEMYCNDDPENLKPGTQTLTAEMALDRTCGQRIAYFADREQMKEFLVEKIKFPRQMLGFVDERGGDLPTIFIDELEPKNCLQFFFGYSTYIADPDNPFYDAEKAQEKAINLLWDAEAVTTHAVNYLLEHNFLPDIENDRIFSRHNSPQQTRADIDFVMRFWRRENY